MMTSIISLGSHGKRMNKVNIAWHIFRQLSPWLSQCSHQTTLSTACRPMSNYFPNLLFYID